MSNEKLQPYETKMQKSLDALEREYTTIRAGRANPHILDKLKVDYYGTPTPLQQVGNVTVPEARVLMIQPWESKLIKDCLLYTSPSPRDLGRSRMPSSA